MSDWMNKVISNDLEGVYEGLDATEDALFWLRQRPRTFGELRAQDIDWLRWMAANIRDQDLLENLSRDPDGDVRMWVACNPMTPKPVLWELAEDPVVFVRRGVAQNSNSPEALLESLERDVDYVVRALARWNRKETTSLFCRQPVN